MEAADELYGVTMAPGGSSRAIKQRIEKPKANLNSGDGEKVIDLVSMEQAQAQAQAQDEDEDADEAILESSI